MRRSAPELCRAAIPGCSAVLLRMGCRGRGSGPADRGSADRLPGAADDVFVGVAPSQHAPLALAAPPGLQHSRRVSATWCCIASACPVTSRLWLATSSACAGVSAASSAAAGWAWHAWGSGIRRQQPGIRLQLACMGTVSQSADASRLGGRALAGPGTPRATGTWPPHQCVPACPHVPPGLLPLLLEVPLQRALALCRGALGRLLASAGRSGGGSSARAGRSLLGLPMGGLTLQRVDGGHGGTSVYSDDER